MTDLFGHQTPPQAFKDIRNTRPSVAEEKAQLCLALGEKVKRCPPSVASGSIQVTRAWVATQKAAIKVLKSSRSSVFDLQQAIKSMDQYIGDAA
jgi:hypothetical protein